MGDTINLPNGPVAAKKIADGYILKVQNVDDTGAATGTGGGGGGGAGTEYTEDAAAPADPVGGALLARRRDTLTAAEVSADGDVIALNATAKGQLHIRDADADALFGGVTEAAPASDTASSGLNGRLQRIAQRITSLIGLLPASLGAKTSAASLSVAPATDWAVPDGADATQGAKADAAWSGTGSGSVVAILKALWTALTGTLIVGGAVADGSAPTSNAVRVSGIDGAGNKRTFLTDTGGRMVQAPATGTSTLLSAAASTNATSVKASAGILRQISGNNASSSARYLKLYDKATAPTVGTDTPRKTIYLAPNAPFVFDMNDLYAVGIAYGITGAAALADTTALAAGDILCLNVDYN